MNANGDGLSLDAVFCQAHDKLMARYQQAMELWARRRHDARCMGLRGSELGVDLFCLQAEFASAYVALHKHRRECPVCSCVRNDVRHEATRACCTNSPHAHPE